MNVLSLFDGISCGQLALQRAGIAYDKYYASEIKHIAIETTKLHFPKTIHVGDVTKLTAYDLPKIDVLIGGSPCQDFSLAKLGGKGLEGDKSRLFYEYLRLWKDLKPKYFFLENVRMKKESKEQLDRYLGVEGVEINSNLVSYQNRARVYWTNIPYEIPQDKGVSFQDYKEIDASNLIKYKLNPDRATWQKMWNDGKGDNSFAGGCANVTNSDKIYCITRRQDRNPNSGLVAFDGFCRYLTHREPERGQTLPEGYTSHLTYRQAQDVIGDGWTVDLIAQIFKGIKSGEVADNSLSQFELFV